MTDRTEMSTTRRSFLSGSTLAASAASPCTCRSGASWSSQGDSEVTQFLGAPGELLLFDRPATLAVYAATDDPDEPVGLRGHPRWAELTERPEVDSSRSRT